MSSSSSISPEEPPPWAELPPDLTAAILLKLGAVEVLKTAQNVCKTWRRVCWDPAMWRRIDFRPGDLHFSLDMEKMCRRAVDLSQGQLTKISVHHFGSDHLLLYIAQRSSQLRSLELSDHVFLRVLHITGGGLIEAVKSLALLEELHLHYTRVEKGVIETIGMSCPLLTSFKLNNGWACDDELTLAIARNMPQLRHLQLIGSEITNQGFASILDGCPRLESLDLRKCWNVCVSGDIRRLLLSRGIKDLRLPDDPMDDYLFAEYYRCDYLLQLGFLRPELGLFCCLH